MILFSPPWHWLSLAMGRMVLLVCWEFLHNCRSKVVMHGHVLLALVCGVRAIDTQTRLLTHPSSLYSTSFLWELISQSLRDTPEASQFRRKLMTLSPSRKELSAGSPTLPRVTITKSPSLSGPKEAGLLS